MPQVQLTDEVFAIAKQRATTGGFDKVDEYIEALLCRAVADAEADRLFTPERMARITIGEADIAAGRTYTSAEVAAHFAARRASGAAVR